MDCMIGAMQKTDKGCDPKDVALKSFFLGPQAENGPWVMEMVAGLFEAWFSWRKGRFPRDGRAVSDEDMSLPEFQERRNLFQARFSELISRFEREVPKFSPRYVGHMFSEISLPALLGHTVALLHNPNNISGESARVGVEIETEALEALKKMVGYQGDEVPGHFTSGGTIANIESLIRARARMAQWLSAGAWLRASSKSSRDLFSSAHLGWEVFREAASESPELSSWNWIESNPFEVAKKLSQVFETEFSGPVALIPENKHYSWKKGVSLLGMGDTALWPVALDEKGRLSISHLRKLLEKAAAEQRPVLMTVSVVGSTELGSVDPVHQVQAVLDEWSSRGIRIWHHVDAAYGGFFRAVNLGAGSLLSDEARAGFVAIERSDSVTLDPHKLGYVPYSCGAFLCRDFSDYSCSSFSGPYVQSGIKERGIFTLEGSRAATGAAATWMTARSIGLDHEGYGRILERTIRIKRALESALERADQRLRIAPHTDTNILAFTWAERGSRLSDANAAAERIFEAFSPQGDGPFFVSKTRLSAQSYAAYIKEFTSRFDAVVDSSEVTVVRVCIMNPFFDSVEMNTDFLEEFTSSVIRNTPPSSRSIRSEFPHKEN